MKFAVLPRNALPSLYFDGYPLHCFTPLNTPS